MNPIELKLARAKTDLILAHPFIGTVALNMPFELTDRVPTAATNGKRVLFNPEFVASLSSKEVTFLVAHECLHPMLEHNFRRGSRDPQRWNEAADYVINQLLTDEGIGCMPKIGLLDRGLYDAGGGVSESIYNLLHEKGDPQRRNGKGALDNCEDGEGSPAEQAQAQAEWKVRVAQAAQSARMHGKLSANMQRLVDTILIPKVDWRSVLDRFLVRCRNDTRSFARLNRRFLSQKLYLPSASGETMGEIVFAVDCSGSITGEEINQFAAEIRKVKEDLCPEMIHVVYFDSDVSHVDSYTPDDVLDIKPHGGGGTDFAPVFEEIEQRGIEPVAVVFLTDLCCNSFGNEPACPVLWVSTHDKSAPFGEVVMM